MPVEAGTTISALDSLWPLSGDFIQQGDDHLRLIKAVLKAQFPGSGGSGFNTPITASEAEINRLSGATSNIQTQIDSLAASSGIEIPSGTVMLFKQSTAPAGWTQIATDDDSMLRMVSGSGGGSGGSTSPISFSVTHSHTTGSHALTLAEMPTHTHFTSTNNSPQTTYLESNQLISKTRGSGAGIGNSNYEYNLGGNSVESNLAGKTTPAGSSSPHTHGDTNTFTSVFTPRYVNIIQASKD